MSLLTSTLMERSVAPVDPFRTHVELLDHAGKLIDKHLQQDAKSSTVFDVGRLAYGGPTASGLHETDYPTLDGVSNIQQMSVTNKVPLPAEVMEHFGHMQCHCMMGLFTDIHRAWLTIDSDIYVWTYEHGSDVAFFDGLGETIASVGLVKPKPGVFQSFIKYLLVLTTNIDIIILGVTFSNSKDGPLGPLEEMHLLPDPVFAMPTDGIVIDTIVGTDSGRIFLGGHDGSLFEITYQAGGGWFGKRCKKINHSTSTLSFLVPAFVSAMFAEEDSVLQISVDNSRHLLYTLSQKGNIEVWNLGNGDNSMSRITKLSMDGILYQAKSIVRDMENSMFEPIVAISAVECSESQCVYLVAFSRAGVRLYFTTLNIPRLSSTPTQFEQQQVDSMGFQPQMDQDLFNSICQQKPSTLQIVHVRLPPGYTASSLQRPICVKTAMYSKGTAVLIADSGSGGEVAWCMSSDAYPYNPQLREAFTIIPLDGNVWFAAESKRMDVGIVPRSPSLSMITPDPPLVVRQHMEPPRKFIFLTQQGAEIMTKLRPVDMLRSLLVANNGPEGQAVVNYFREHGQSQSCAEALILACLESPQGQRLAEWATQAFFQYGGEPQALPQQPQPIMQQQQQLHFTLQGGFNPSVVSTPVNSRQPFHSAMSPHQHPTSSSFHQQSGLAPTGDPLTPLTSNQSHQRSYVSPIYPDLSQVNQSGNVNQSHYATNQSFASPNVIQHSQAMMTPQPNPVSPTPITSPQRSFQADHGAQTVLFSPRHDGLYIYGSRIIRPLWNLPAVCCTQEANRMFILSSISREDVLWILGHLQALKTFLDKHQQMTLFSRNLQKDVLSTSRIAQLDTFQEEKKSLEAFKTFISHSCEVLGMWRILCEHQFHVIVNNMPKELQNQLANITFRTLILVGHEFCSNLINSLINTYLNDNASVDFISRTLRDICPHLYCAEDATCSKANEMLLSARNTPNKAEQEAKLQEALELCKKIAPQVNLPQICQWLAACNFYIGILDLVATYAAKLDPKQLALHYYKNNEPTGDEEGYRAYVERMQCYKEITNIMEYLFCMSTANPYQPRIPQSPGAVAPMESRDISNEEAKAYIHELITRGLGTEDELLHVALYSWLFSKQLTSELSLVNQPSYETFLLRAIQRKPESVQEAELLWQLQERRGDHAAAAQMLYKLAFQEGNRLALRDRISYLARAVMCLRSERVGCAPNLGVFLRDLEDKMEVARLQQQILDALSIKPKTEQIEEAINQLNSTMMDITELYENYAEPFNLWECKLAIIHCSGHHDSMLIESIWQNIIDLELQACAGVMPNDKIAVLVLKVKTLGKDYALSPRCFPVAFLVKHLEIQCVRVKADPGQVHKMFLDLGIPYIKLLQVYESLVAENDRIWAREGRELHIVESTGCLLESIASNPKAVGLPERRLTISRAIDVMTKCLTFLYTEPNTEYLVNVLRGTQAKLKRIIGDL